MLSALLTISLFPCYVLSQNTGIKTCTPTCPTTYIPPTPTTQCRCGDPKLGPTSLPTQPIVLAQLLDGYDTFGGLGVQQYLNEWLDTSNPAKLKYRNPPGSGFTIDACGNEKKTVHHFKKGELVDRVGAVDGPYLAPVCDPIKNRAIPPRNLCNTGTPVYTVFEVCEEFWAYQGQAQPWFNQAGLGNHIALPDGLSTKDLRTGSNHTLRILSEDEVASLNCPNPKFTPKCSQSGYKVDLH
ncbi:hypothetical protein BO78DRAFT_435191 [Aspergillus sclerotiicarbonarius CBS 121057]|uniref:TNT domain-containing protein n=1 Tax=Aspergillus sclerotiicarbonarius (strain CBS 121057 / IBT 28362) TaxID=1448318 RepID=A0A319EQT1_ASPSB|nr:hypothetical protein BO78DRAFT_435191 [Aspergillus sclerotiicarbonarius CBS 121057]